MTTPYLDLPAQYLAQVRTILQTYVPEYEVWAYGSRVRGEAFAASDLDLVVRNPRHLSEPCDHIVALREAFVASNLPIRVDVVDWARIPPSFHHEIERGYVVVQPAMSTDNVRED
ncbi:MAG: nucleotidyltransferase family protein [Chloroflexus sp.]|uniref:nucleotidyltransferase family protein n=1 Tax=Chloroflexus sp. TaxID=1904827 RepID=UPI002ADDAE1B|nr:nucleotidyltransferase domain-containing protein [Chloroflexus sp.]